VSAGTEAECDRGPRATWLWIGLWALAFLALTRGIASVPLMDPDEGRNAEVAREMAERVDFVVPHLNGLPYLDKPVFFFASAALAVGALGATELAARLPSLLATCAAVALIVAFGWRLFGRRTAALAGLMLATSPLVLAFARIVIFDSMLMLWVSVSCVAFFFAWQRDGAWWIAAWAAAGCAALTKGPVGLALPLLVNLTYAWICGERARRMFHPLGMLAFALVVAPWFFAVTARHPEFPHYAFVRETFERATTDRMQRTGPIYYFLVLLIGGGFPWLLVPLVGLWRSSTPALASVGRRLAWVWRERRHEARSLVYLMLWIAVPLVLFSLSQSKRPGYILPVFPAVALLCARAFFAWPSARRGAAWIYLTSLIVVGIVVATGVGPLTARIDVPAIAEAVRVASPAIGAALLLAALTTAVALRLDAPLALIAGFALLPTLAVLGGQPILDAMGAYRSGRTIAESVRAANLPDTRIIGVEVYPASLSFYLGTRIPVSTAHGYELKSNYIVEYEAALREAPDSPLRPAEWWRSELQNCAEPTIFVIKTSHTHHRAELETRLPLLGAGQRYTAFGPCQKGAS